MERQSQRQLRGHLAPEQRAGAGAGKAGAAEAEEHVPEAFHSLCSCRRPEPSCCRAREAAAGRDSAGREDDEAVLVYEERLDGEPRKRIASTSREGALPSARRVAATRYEATSDVPCECERQQTRLPCPHELPPACAGIPDACLESCVARAAAVETGLGYTFLPPAAQSSLSSTAQGRVTRSTTTTAPASRCVAGTSPTAIPGIRQGAVAVAVAVLSLHLASAAVQAWVVCSRTFSCTTCAVAVSLPATSRVSCPASPATVPPSRLARTSTAAAVPPSRVSSPTEAVPAKGSFSCTAFAISRIRPRPISFSISACNLSGAFVPRPTSVTRGLARSFASTVRTCCISSTLAPVSRVRPWAVAFALPAANQSKSVACPTAVPEPEPIRT
jgi:hypothetical protein